MNALSFTVLHNDAFPDGTYAEIAFDASILSPADTTAVAVATADTSGGPEPLNTNSVAVTDHDTVNCTTVDQADTFTEGGSITIDSIEGLNFGAGGVLVVPVALTIVYAL